MNHQANKHDEWAEEKNRKIEAYKKGRYQRKRNCETQMELVEVENDSLCPRRCSLHYALTVEFPSLK